MKIYVKSYKSRIYGILISVLSVFVAVLICSLLFGNKANSISSQLKSYSVSRYSYIYKLNYPLGTDDEYIYVDTNIFIYADSYQKTRIPTIVLMQNDNCSYNESSLGYSDIIRSDEVVLARNIADEYHLSVGDKIYAKYPYSNEVVSLTIVALSDVNYDFENPDIDNNIGITILGFNEQYAKNSENKSLCFSSISLNKEISNHPQILDTIYYKTSNYEYVFCQGLHILVIEALMIIAAITASEFFFYRYSHSILRRLYLKGMTRVKLKTIPFIEHVVLTVIPTIIAILLRLHYIPATSGFVGYLCGIDIILTVVYSLLFGFRPFKRTSNSVR